MVSHGYFVGDNCLEVNIALATLRSVVSSIV